MASTPEGKVKRKVSALLGSYSGLYYYMPVPGGYGGVTLDYLGIYRGFGFAIETKAPGKKPTDRQWATLEQIANAGGMIFVISDDAGVASLKSWLDGLSRIS